MTRHGRCRHRAPRHRWIDPRQNAAQILPQPLGLGLRRAYHDLPSASASARHAACRQTHSPALRTAIGPSCHGGKIATAEPSALIDQPSALCRWYSTKPSVGIARIVVHRSAAMTFGEPANRIEIAGRSIRRSASQTAVSLDAASGRTVLRPAGPSRRAHLVEDFPGSASLAVGAGRLRPPLENRAPPWAIAGSSHSVSNAVMMPSRPKRYRDRQTDRGHTRFR